MNLSTIKERAAPATNTTLTEVRDRLPENGPIAEGFLRRLFKTLSRLTYDTTNQLRVYVGSGSVAVSSGTVTTVTTVTTANSSIGDIGKPSTAILMSRMLVSGSTQSRIRRV